MINKSFTIWCFLIFSLINESGYAQGLYPPMFVNDIAVPSDFPEYSVNSIDPSNGYVFVANDSGQNNYILIIGTDGTPLYHRKLDRQSRNFEYQKDLEILSITIPSTGLEMNSRVASTDFGEYILFNNSLNVLDTIRPANNYFIDDHDMEVTSDSTVLLLVVENRVIDMSQIVEGGEKEAVVRGNHIQEVDFKGNLLFEWICWDYFELIDCYDPLDGLFVDFTHSNSIALDYDGHIIVSNRHFSECTKINRTTGDIIWRLGGKNNQFEFLNEDLSFSYQHDFKAVSGKPNYYTLFDNGNFRGDSSRVVEYLIDPVNLTATKTWEYFSDEIRYSPSKSNAQRLQNEHTLIDWVYEPDPEIMEIDREGNVVWSLDVNFSTYRAFKYDLSLDIDQPNLSVENFQNYNRLLLNHFGKTNIEAYQIFQGLSPDNVSLFTTTTESYFDLFSDQSTEDQYIKIKSIDKEGTISEYSNSISIIAEKNIVNQSFALLGKTDEEESSDPEWVSSDDEIMLALDGIDDEINLDKNFQFSDGTLTISIGIMLNTFDKAKNYPLLLGEFDQSNLNFEISQNRLELLIEKESYNYTISTLIPDNTFLDQKTVNLTGSISQDSLTLFIDNQQLSSVAISNEIENLFFENLSVGLGTTNYLDGTIASVLIWNDTLSESQINSIIGNNEICRNSKLIGYWNFNENFGQRSLDLSVNNSQVRNNDWQMLTTNNAQADISIEGDEIAIELISSGSNQADIIVKEEGFSLVKNRKYLISFNVVAEEDQILSFKLSKSSTPFNNYSRISSFTAKQGNHKYIFEFEMLDDTDLDADLIFNIGLLNKNIQLSEIEMSDINGNISQCSEAEEFEILKTEDSFSSFLYPNPFKSTILVPKVYYSGSYIIFNMNGSTVAHGQVTKDGVIDLANRNLNKGVFTIILTPKIDSMLESKSFLIIKN